VTGLELEDAGEDGPGRHRRPEGEGLIEPDRIEGARQRRVASEQRLDLAGEDDPAPVLGVVKRPHPQPIAGQRQSPAARVPQPDGELSVEPRERLLAPGLVGVDDHLGVAGRPEGVPQRLQFGAQLAVVEDLAVERHPQRAVLVAQRLLAGREVDDRQPGVGQPGPLVPVDPKFIRSAVVEGAGHGAQLGRRRRTCLRG
jgi:hypothetical protein